MRRILWALLALLPLHAGAQVRHGYVIGAAREQLAAAWDSTNPYQVERVYQVVEDTLLPKGIDERDPAYIVFSVVPCFVQMATPGSVRYNCPDESAPTIHVHTPATCSRDFSHCVMGGEQAYDANPSRADRRTLQLRRSAYAVVQVSRDVFVFYFPGQEQLGTRELDPAGPKLGRDLYATALVGTVTANAITHFITDPGGYPKQWDQWSVFHFTAGYGIESLGASFEVPMRWRLPLACGSLAAWEKTKGYFDWRDVTAGCAGVLTSAGVRAIARRIVR